MSAPATQPPAPTPTETTPPTVPTPTTPADSASPLNPQSIKINFTGNPGVGKSTLLNTILQKLIFKNGKSTDGAGKTSLVQYTQDSKGNTLIDTPGLFDIAHKHCAQEKLKRVLQLGGQFKIVFVVVPEAGRIIAQDKAAILEVLNAAPVINQSYAILINKVEPEVMQGLQDANNKKTLEDGYNEGLPGTQYFYYQPLQAELSAKDNVFGSQKMGADLQSFLEGVPVVVIDPAQVGEVKDSGEQKIEELQKQKESEEAAKKQLEEKQKQEAEQQQKAAEEEKAKTAELAAQQQNEQNNAQQEDCECDDGGDCTIS